MALVSSCTKEEIIPSKHNSDFQNVSLIEGRLKFKTMDVFKESIQELSKNKINKIKTTFPDFYSARDVFSNLIKNEFVDYKDYPNIVIEVYKNDELYLEPIIDYDLLSYFVNENGIIQIGDQIYKLTYDKLYQTNVSNLSQLTNNNFNNLGVKSSKIIRETTEITLRSDDAQCDSGIYKKKRRKYKVSGELSTIASNIYSEIRCNSKHRKKAWYGAWIYKDAPWIKMDCDGLYSVSIDGGGTWVDQFDAIRYEYETDEAELHHLFDFAINESGTRYRWDDTDLFAQAKGLDNKLHSCTIHYSN